MNMREIYFPKLDFVITFAITAILGAIGGLTFLNDAYWVFLIYIISLGLTNLNKISIKKIDKKNAKKRKKVQKDIDNPRSPKKDMPKKLKEIDRNYDYDSCFSILKFILGMLATMVLAIISYVGEKFNIEFSKFAFSFYIDAFLMPLVILCIEVFAYRNSFVEALKDFLNTFFRKNGKLKILRGMIGLGFSIFFVILSLIFTMQEFVIYQHGILVRVGVFLIGISFLIYSFYNAIKQKS